MQLWYYKIESGQNETDFSNCPIFDDTDNCLHTFVSFFVKGDSRIPIP